MLSRLTSLLDFLYCLRFLFLSSLIRYLDLQKQISNLADIFLGVVNFSDDTWVWGGDFRELLIGGYIGEFLELFNRVSLLDVEFLYCAFFDLLAQIGQIEFYYAELVHSVEEQRFGSSNRFEG